MKGPRIILLRIFLKQIKRWIVSNTTPSIGNTESDGVVDAKYGHNIIEFEIRVILLVL
jgi:hypothetical protein